MKSNYLFYFCDSIGSVFDSQVLALLKAINEKNYFKEIYLFLGVRNEIQRSDFLARKESLEIKTVFFKTYPNYPFFNILTRKSIQNTLLSQSIDFKEAIFHTRGEMIAWHLSKILETKYHKNIIPDVRGASIEEIEEFSDLNKIVRSLKIINNKKAIRNLNKFNTISVVSKSLKEYLVTNHNIDPAKIVITPCLAETAFRFDEAQRECIRKEFKISINDILVVFSSGGTANWQNNEVLIMLAKKGLKVLNLSKREILHKNVFNKFISYTEVPLYLNAADFAIIWRDKSIVNKVASPVKFSEYVCCGLPVIANDSIDMIKEFIVKNSCGLIKISLDEIEINSLAHLRQIDRKAIAESGLSLFGIDVITKSYARIYSGLKNL